MRTQSLKSKLNENFGEPSVEYDRLCSDVREQYVNVGKCWKRICQGYVAARAAWVLDHNGRLLPEFHQDFEDRTGIAKALQYPLAKINVIFGSMSNENFALFDLNALQFLVKKATDPQTVEYARSRVKGSNGKRVTRYDVWRYDQALKVKKGLKVSAVAPYSALDHYRTRLDDGSIMFLSVPRGTDPKSIRLIGSELLAQIAPVKSQTRRKK
jgi:hypothetical protein